MIEIEYALNKGMIRMKWTTKQPKKEGWYWFRGEKWRLDPDTKGPIIVRIRFVKSLGMIFCDGRLPQLVGSWPGEFAGPIPFPSDSKHALNKA
jgi:hypothetical protein